MAVQMIVYSCDFTGAAIIVIMVIAVVIGMVIFIGGIIYLKR